MCADSHGVRVCDSTLAKNATFELPTLYSESAVECVDGIPLKPRLQTRHLDGFDESNSIVDFVLDRTTEGESGPIREIACLPCFRSRLSQTLGVFHLLICLCLQPFQILVLAS